MLTALDGVEGLERALKDSPDLVVLDVMMPRMSGLDVCKQLKAKRPSIPIIMLTARGQEVDKVVGLKLGLDIALEGVDDAYSWIPANLIERAHVATDTRGEATVPWFPGEKVKHAYPTLRGPLWKMDQLDRDKVAEGITTIHVRRTVLVKGKLNMPGGTSAEGIMVSGFGFGPGGTGQVPVARAASDFHVDIFCTTISKLASCRRSLGPSRQEKCSTRKYGRQANA